jgi:hypothetical protein
MGMNSVRKKRWRLERDSFHLMRVYFKDGKKRTFYSRDWKHAYSSVRNPDIGFENYRKMIQKWGEDARTVLIYNIVTNTEVAKYYKGQEVSTADDL